MQDKGGHAINFKDNFSIFRVNAEEFDMPYWAHYAMNESGDLSEIAKYNNTFCYQLKRCNLHCPWCYVDDISKDGSEKNNPDWFSISQIVDEFEKARELHAQGNGSCEGPLNNYRPSGGEPTLAVEQWLLSLRELEKRKLDDEVFVQGDTNLTTGHFIESLEKSGTIEKHLLNKVGERNNFGLLCSFKGTDTESFLNATGMMPSEYAFLEEERWHTFEKYVKAGIDAYPFVYDPNPETLPYFLDDGANRFGDGFYLKTWILPLKLYGPEIERYAKKSRITLGDDKELRDKFKKEVQQNLDERFAQSKEVMQKILWDKFRLNYQEITRPRVKLNAPNFLSWFFSS